MQCKTCKEPLKYRDLVAKGAEFFAPEIYAVARESGAECSYCSKERRRTASRKAISGAQPAEGGE